MYKVDSADLACAPLDLPQCFDARVSVGFGIMPEFSAAIELMLRVCVSARESARDCRLLFSCKDECAPLDSWSRGCTRGHLKKHTTAHRRYANMSVYDTRLCTVCARTCSRKHTNPHSKQGVSTACSHKTYHKTSICRVVAGIIENVAP